MSLQIETFTVWVISVTYGHILLSYLLTEMTIKFVFRCSNYCIIFHCMVVILSLTDEAYTSRNSWGVISYMCMLVTQRELTRKLDTFMFVAISLNYNSHHPDVISITLIAHHRRLSQFIQIHDMRQWQETWQECLIAEHWAWSAVD